jgi:hypothetical protein
MPGDYSLRDYNDAQTSAARAMDAFLKATRNPAPSAHAIVDDDYILVQQEDGVWRWQCTNNEQSWHYTIDDSGYAGSYREAHLQAIAHLQYRHPAEPVLCGKRLNGRLSLRCNQLIRHDGCCAYVTADGRAFHALTERRT